MQRSCPKEEPKSPTKREEEEEHQQQQQQESLGASTGDPKKRCVVIMEGNPHPGALKGRMSFRSFNPSIDKLHQEAANMYQTPAANTNHQSSGPERGSESQEVANSSSDQDIDLKRKQPEMEMDTPSPNKLQKVATGESSGQSSSQNGTRGSDKQQKREKLDWNVLRPPKPQIKRR
ncbi:uncharacterized protein M6B38_164175 [Iris pallida]|uniref:Uncharacterized protein n=1 Tax=Iris pallida TaxID=29817 RepID=A0AAX6EYA2_IRIPA|nr:uncharacterized protein M6B38_164175 [Iris pallida]